MISHTKRRIAWWLMILVVAFLLATAVLPLLPVDQWWIRFGDFPRLQFLVAYLMAFLLLWFFRRQEGVGVAASALAIACLIQFYWIHSYLPLATPQVENAQSKASDKQLRAWHQMYWKRTQIRKLC
ncbi:hypothetical protein [Novipirellula rosea]|uniref:Uncharacterized protein n=1 Tax=Novipirellula rosea TaxID=1031540 RepID=A0ABP8NIJ2_9BACT